MHASVTTASLQPLQLVKLLRLLLLQKLQQWLLLLQPLVMLTPSSCLQLLVAVVASELLQKVPVLFLLQQLLQLLLLQIHVLPLLLSGSAPTGCRTMCTLFAKTPYSPLVESEGTQK